MKDPSKEKIVLLTLNDNTKLQGILVKIDKENLKIILEKGKTTSPDGKVTVFDKTEIFKKDIKEIRLVEEKEKPKETEPIVTPSSTITNNKLQNTSEKETDRVNENPTDGSTFNPIPLNIQEKYQNDTYKYDKDGFFDTKISPAKYCRK